MKQLIKKGTLILLNAAYGVTMLWILFFHAIELFWYNQTGGRAGSYAVYRFYHIPSAPSCREGLYHYSAFFIMLALIAGMIITGLVVRKLRALVYLPGVALFIFMLIPVIIRPIIYCTDHVHRPLGIPVDGVVIAILLLVSSTTLFVMQLFKNKHDPIKT
jgi:hypothetical protein